MSCYETAKATLGADAIAFVEKRLGLPWPWLAADLIDAFDGGAKKALMGMMDAQILVVLDPPNPPAPQVSWTFETQPGEMVREALQRLQHEAEAIYATLKAPLEPTVPQGYMPKQDQREKLARYAKWFYLNRLREKSINALAGRIWPTLSGDSIKFTRQAIAYGIREAERLLKLSSFSSL